jgi:NitT/TauT family transport system permease protein
MALTTVDLKDLKGFGLADLLVLSLLVAMVAGIAILGRQWDAPYHSAFQIDLSTGALFYDGLLTLARSIGAYGVSLFFTLWWGLWAARSKAAERILIPLADILQSTPVLALMPGLVIGLERLFRHSRLGLELAGILLIFISQAWNMVLAFYQSLKAVPEDLKSTADQAGLAPWKRFLSMDLPCGMSALAWNSMMSMAGAWFFLTAAEAFQLGDKDFRMPGLGSYMLAAVEAGDTRAMLGAFSLMALLVIAVDQFLWRPILAWAFRFRMEEREGEEAPDSWIFDFLQRSKSLQRLGDRITLSFIKLVLYTVPGAVLRPLRRKNSGKAGLEIFEGATAVAFAVIMFWGSWRLLSLLAQLSLSQWQSLCFEAGLTLGRTLLAMALGAAWAVPLGVKIGMNSRLAKVFAPLAQVTASFPAPMLFPLLFVVFFALGIHLNFASIILMMAASAWYVLFHVIVGASQIPVEQREVWAFFGPEGWARFRRFILPAIFPSLLIGLETATGGAWNASILTEYFRLHNATFTARGLGATINLATEEGDFALLAASVLLMVLIVVSINRLLWHKLYDVAARNAHA